MPCTRGWGTPGLPHRGPRPTPEPRLSVTLAARGLSPLPWASKPLHVPVSMWTTMLVSVCMDTCGPFCRAHGAVWLGGPDLGEAQPPVTGLGACADGTSWDSGHHGSLARLRAESSKTKKAVHGPGSGAGRHSQDESRGPGSQPQMPAAGEPAAGWGTRGAAAPTPLSRHMPWMDSPLPPWRRRLIWFSQKKGRVKHLVPGLASGSSVPSVARLSVEGGPRGRGAPGLLGGGPPWHGAGVVQGGRAPVHTP